jgi:hypothetical protein
MRDTPTRHVVPEIVSASIYGVYRSWFRGPARFAEVRGNPVGIRDCPAAVNGNESRPLACAQARTGVKHWAGQAWEAAASRERLDRRCARESEDLPARRAPPGARRLRPRGTADGLVAACLVLARRRSLACPCSGAVGNELARREP